MNQIERDMERTAQVYFSEGILTEIFYRLPMKSVFRFKSVSKACLSLISDPSFVRGYTSRASTSLQPPPWTLLRKVFQIHDDLILPCRNFLRNIDASRFDQDQPSLSELAFCSAPNNIQQQASGHDHLMCDETAAISNGLSELTLCSSPNNIQQPSCHDDGPMCYEIAAISNGFLLCRLYGRDIYYQHYCMINPITWQCIELPPLPKSKYCPVFAESFLAQVDQVLGVFQRYIVVLPKHSSNWKTKHHMVEVFSSETGRWREYIVESPKPFEMLLISTISFGANKRIHWYCSSGWQTNDLVAYDPFDDCNSCRIIQFPSDGQSTDCVRVLDEFQGRLRCIRSTITNHSSYVWEVWTLIGEFEEGDWTLVHRIAQSDHPLLDGEFLPISNPDPNIFYFRGSKGEDDLVSYNIQTRECKVMDDMVKLDAIMLQNCPRFVLPPWPTTVPS